MNKVNFPICGFMILCAFFSAAGCATTEGYRSEPMTLVGKIQDVPQQHLLANPRGKFTYYVEVEEGKQVIVYSSSRITCAEPVRLTGRWMTQEGASEARWERPLSERQFEVTQWKCVR